MTLTKKPTGVARTGAETGAEIDAALAAAAQGVGPTSDDADALPEDDDRRETDVIGDAAGLAIHDGRPLGGPDEIERRDAHRWELDPASAESSAASEPGSSETGGR